MNLCFDYSAALQQGAGIGRYGREMLPRLRELLGDDQLSLFTNNAGQVKRDPALAALRWHTVPWSNKVWRLRVALDYLRRGTADHYLPGVDLFFAADHLLPRLGRAAGVINIRDLSYLTHPGYHRRFSRVYQRLMMPHFARHARAIVVPSAATRADLITYYRTPPERITVIPEGVDAQFHQPVTPSAVAALRARLGLARPFILYVGTLEPRKNIIGLLDAFAALVADPALPAVDLVLGGGRGWLYQPTLDHLARLDLGDRVRQIGYVADADLPALYGAAAVFAFPSWAEGFGLPPLEALACGTPVVASSAASLPEVVGDAGLLVDPAELTGAGGGASGGADRRPAERPPGRRRPAARRGVYLGAHRGGHARSVPRRGDKGLAMQIALDVRATDAHFPGIARATLGLLSGLIALPDDFRLDLICNADRPAPAARAALDDARLRWHTVAAGPLSLAQQWQLPPLARRLRPAVWHAPYYVRPFLGLPPTVVTVFDLIGLRVPGALSARGRLLFALALRCSLLTARAIITSSEATRHDLLALGQVDPARLHVVPLGVEQRFAPQPAAAVAALRARYGLPRRYVLYLGSNKPHKQPVVAVAACREYLPRPRAGRGVAGRRRPLGPALPRCRGGRRRTARPPPATPRHRRRRSARAAQRRRGVCVSVAVRGLWAAAAGGDGLRRAGGRVEPLQPARGRGRRRAARCADGARYGRGALRSAP